MKFLLPNIYLFHHYMYFSQCISYRLPPPLSFCIYVYIDHLSLSPSFSLSSSLLQTFAIFLFYLSLALRPIPKPYLHHLSLLCHFFHPKYLQSPASKIFGTQTRTQCGREAVTSLGPSILWIRCVRTCNGN